MSYFGDFTLFHEEGEVICPYSWHFIEEDNRSFEAVIYFVKLSSVVSGIEALNVLDSNIQVLPLH